MFRSVKCATKHVLGVAVSSVKAEVEVSQCYLSQSPVSVGPMWHKLCHWCWNSLNVSRGILSAVLPVSIEKLWRSVIRSSFKFLNSGQDHELSSLSHSIEPNLEFFILSETKSGILINDELSFSNTLSGSIFNRPTKFLGWQNGFPFFGIGNLSISIIFVISGSFFSDFSSFSIFSGSFGFTKRSYRDSKRLRSQKFVVTGTRDREQVRSIRNGPLIGFIPILGDLNFLVSIRDWTGLICGSLITTLFKASTDPNWLVPDGAVRSWPSSLKTEI